MHLQVKAKLKHFFTAVLNLASFAIPHLTPQTQPLQIILLTDARRKVIIN